MLENSSQKQFQLNEMDTADFYDWEASSFTEKNFQVATCGEKVQWRK